MTDTTDTTETPTPWALARTAGCNEPDNMTSPGAEWLVRVYEDALEAYEWTRDNEPDAFGDEWTSDTAHERADGIVPVYTYDLWRTFVDLGAWEAADEAAEEGLLAEDADMDTRARVALYTIARVLVADTLEGLVEEWREGVDVCARGHVDPDVSYRGPGAPTCLVIGCGADVHRAIGEEADEARERAEADLEDEDEGPDDGGDAYSGDAFGRG